MQTTDGGLLDNRLIYRQPAFGYRTGIEPVLLAAAIPAAPGASVLEAGAGAGAALLCLAARVPELHGVALERDPAMAALAAHNLASNGFSSCRAVTGDVTLAPSFGIFDHVFANPPWHDPAGTPSPLREREQAKRAPPDTSEVWANALARALRPRGTITLIVPSAAVPSWLAALEAAGCGSPTLLPLWPRRGKPAKLVLLTAARDARGTFVILPGLTLHDEAGFTPDLQALLGTPVALSLTRDRQRRKRPAA